MTRRSAVHGAVGHPACATLCGWPLEQVGAFYYRRDRENGSAVRIATTTYPTTCKRCLKATPRKVPAP